MFINEKKKYIHTEEKLIKDKSYAAISLLFDIF